MFKGLANTHKRQFDNYVLKAGTSVTVRQPVGKVQGGSAVDRVLGTARQEREHGETQDVLAVVTYDLSSAIEDDDMKPIVASLGKLHQLDAVLRVRLEDALPDPKAPHTPSLFETAKDVLLYNQTYEVTGAKRTGLPPLPPYILWVGLRKVD